MAGLGGPFNRFLGATLISSLGDGLLITALPLLARVATSNPTMIAGVFAAGRLPWLAGIVFGSYADRRDARKVMIASDVARGVILSLLVLWLVVAGRPIPIFGLYIAAFLLSAFFIVFWAASNRATPAVVVDENLEAANGRFMVVNNVGGEFVGPALGPILLFEKSVHVVLRSGVLPLAGDAVSFFGSAALLRGLPAVPSIKTETSLRQDVVEGWHWFVGNETVRTITSVVTVTGMLTGMVLSTEVILIKDTLGLSAVWFAAFTMVMAAGAILGGAIGTRAIKLFRGWSTPLCNIIGGLCYLGMVKSRSWPLIFGLMFIQQMWTLISLVQTMTIRQRIIPDHLRGRVMSLSRSIVFGSQIIGALIGGQLIHAGGTDEMLAISGFLILFTGVITAKRLRRLITAATPAPVVPEIQLG
jgi:Major Facilitator Superfamily